MWSLRSTELSDRTNTGGEHVLELVNRTHISMLTFLGTTKASASSPIGRHVLSWVVGCSRASSGGSYQRCLEIPEVASGGSTARNVRGCPEPLRNLRLHNAELGIGT